MNLSEAVAMDDHSHYCTCSPLIKLPTREDLLHPLSKITPEELLKYRTMQTLPPRVKGAVSKYSDDEKIKNKAFKCSEASLAYYNMLNSTNYKLIKASKCNTFLHGWVWHHCVFKAAPENSSVPELFFAELHSIGKNQYHVVTIARVENVTETETYDCSFCYGKNILHPVPTLSRDPDLLFEEGMIDVPAPGVPPELQKSWEKLKKASEQSWWQEIPTYEDEEAPADPADPADPEQFSINNITTTTTSSSSNAKHEGHGKMHIVSSHGQVYMMIPLVDVAPTTIKENIQIKASFSIKRKASDSGGVSPPRRQE